MSPDTAIPELPRHRHRQWWGVLFLLVVAGALAGGWGTYQHRLQQHDQERHQVFVAWSKAFQQAAANKLLPPQGAGSVTPNRSEGALADFGRDLPKPPPKTSALQYQADGNRFVLCSVKMTEKKAEFTTNDSDYTLESAACHDHPSVTAAQFTQQIDLTTDAISTLYVSNPQILPKAQVKARCSESSDTKTTVLGCYDREIYVVNINEPEINGEMDVIAAHELLHAEYDLLSDKDRRQVDQLVEAQAKRIDDPQLKDILTHYASWQYSSELHSRFGTEFGNLSPELERYYQRYFKDRAKLVSEHANYLSVINGLAKEIDTLKADLSSKKVTLERLLANGDVIEYNAEVGPYNDKVTRTNKLVDHYNELTTHTR